MAHVDKKQKTEPEPDRIEAFNVVRIEYYCSNRVLTTIKSYRTMEAAKEGMRKWMLERMHEDIVERGELRREFSESRYDPIMKKIAESLQVYIRSVHSKNKRKKDWTGLDQAIKISMSGKSVEEVYKKFFARNIANDELMEIIKSE